LLAIRKKVILRPRVYYVVVAVAKRPEIECAITIRAQVINQPVVKQEELELPGWR
jgi:hypothetical protein